jgi:hypothetical protein
MSITQTESTGVRKGNCSSLYISAILQYYFFSCDFVFMFFIWFISNILTVYIYNMDHSLAPW